jgi:integrase/recombinase XerD
MLADGVESYVALRRACGFGFKSQAKIITSFAAFSDAKGKHYVSTETAVEWARSARSRLRRARLLGEVIRFARHIHAEDPRHEIPPPVFGSEKHDRPVPFIFSRDDLQRLLHEASGFGRDPFRGHTYRTFFGLLACTGLRVSEALRLRFDDITADGLVIRRSKFQKSRLIPLHPTTQKALGDYLQIRRPYAPFDDHVFVSTARRPLLILSPEVVFRTLVKKIGLPRGPGLPRPTIHSLRHTFAVRALENCPDGRDRITKHMLALSTYLGHSEVAHTYWYLEATPDLMKNIASACESYASGGRP